MNREVFKEEVLRAFVLASTLEPLAEKHGCTTRLVDSSPGTKLEYFTISAMNSGWTMLTLVDRIFEIGGQPNCLFDVAYLAQSKSTRNRLGGKVNYGQIFMLLPIIVAQSLLYLEGKNTSNLDLLFKRVRKSMMDTTEKDVHFLQMFIDLSRKQSEDHHSRLGTSRPQLAPRLVGVYKNIMDTTEAKDFSHTMMAAEIRNGYPQCRDVFEELFANSSDGLLKQSEHVYARLLPEIGRPDVVADCIVVGFYLRLFANMDDVLFI